jgi:hypothetical protein
MKKITLHGPTVRNDGSYADAGVTLTIGDKPEEISSDRAKGLVDIGIAVSETAAKAEDRAPKPTRRRAAKRVKPPVVSADSVSPPSDRASD